MNVSSKNQLTVKVDGAVGETTSLFTLPIKEVTELTVDLDGVTYISSFGVKNWIIWTLKIPAKCSVKLINCPFVIASQASNVVGFMIPNMIIESFKAPYVCDSCDYEGLYLVKNGADYSYSTSTHPRRINLPSNLECPKCKKPSYNNDLLIEKTFKFLT